MGELFGKKKVIKRWGMEICRVERRVCSEKGWGE